MTTQELKIAMNKHAYEKLYLLKDNWFHTDTVKKLAEPLDKTLRHMINGL